MRSKSPYFRLILILLVSGIFAGVLFRGFSLRSRSEPIEEAGQNQKPTIMTSSAPLEPTVETEAPSRLDSENNWKSFQKKFGNALEPEFLKDGRLAAVRGGRVGTGTRPTGPFSPQDPQRVIARAREILAEADKLIGVDSRLPLSEVEANTSATSAQVFFRESIDGIPIAPFGTVTVDLGPDGELLGLDSDYLSKVAVTNSVKLSPDETRFKALAAFSAIAGEQGSVPKVEGGNRVVWVSRPVGRSGSVNGRTAYEYYVQGRQIVVDAENGEVLYRRDRRLNLFHE